MALPANINDRWYDMFTTDGGGNVALRIIGTAGAAVPGNPLTSVQFNSGGGFAGSADFTWDGSRLFVGGGFLLNLDPGITLESDITSAASLSLFPTGAVNLYGGVASGSFLLFDPDTHIELSNGTAPSANIRIETSGEVTVRASADAYFTVAASGDGSVLQLPGDFGMSAPGEIALVGTLIKLQSTGGEWDIDAVTGALFFAFPQDIGKSDAPIASLYAGTSLVVGPVSIQPTGIFVASGSDFEIDVDDGGSNFAIFGQRAAGTFELNASSFTSLRINGETFMLMDVTTGAIDFFKPIVLNDIPGDPSAPTNAVQLYSKAGVLYAQTSGGVFTVDLTPA